MHFCWRLSRGEVLPSDIPLRPDCPIKWDHDNIAKSRAAATEMVNLFGLIFEPSLTSRHVEGKAIDMKISWAGNRIVKDANGNRVELEAPRDGSKNTALHAIGASYGVYKLISDPPHWSIDGR
jgi:hypothetical protein